MVPRPMERKAKMHRMIRGVIFNSVQLRYQPTNNLSIFLSRTIGLVVKIKDPENIYFME